MVPLGHTPLDMSGVVLGVPQGDNKKLMHINDLRAIKGPI